MKNLGEIRNAKDVVTKEYLEQHTYNETNPPPQSSSSGDMLKSDYATASDTSVDNALNAEALQGYEASIFVITDNPSEDIEIPTINADTLDGKPASDFATKEYVDSAIQAAISAAWGASY